MDGHKNYETPKFNTACKKLNIILIYMPPHFFHLLQLLNVNFFLLLKKTYIKKLKNIFQFRINHVNKLKFLKIYKYIQLQIFISSSILRAFKGAKLHPFNFVVVFNLLNAFTKFIIFKNKFEHIQ